jgi:hypothetical protein
MVTQISSPSVPLSQPSLQPIDRNRIGAVKSSDRLPNASHRQSKPYVKASRHFATIEQNSIKNCSEPNPMAIGNLLSLGGRRYPGRFLDHESHLGTVGQYLVL